MVKIKSCVFISGAGTNLKALIHNSRSYNFPINIKLVISDKKNAAGLKLAKKYSIASKIINSKDNLFEIKVLKNKKKMTGCTIHHVNENLDSGKIILKKKFYILDNENVNTLKFKTQKKEYKAFSEAIIKLYMMN